MHCTAVTQLTMHIKTLPSPFAFFLQLANCGKFFLIVYLLHPSFYCTVHSIFIPTPQQSSLTPLQSFLLGIITGADLKFQSIPHPFDVTVLCSTRKWRTVCSSNAVFPLSTNYQNEYLLPDTIHCYSTSCSEQIY